MGKITDTTASLSNCRFPQCFHWMRRKPHRHPFHVGCHKSRLSCWLLNDGFGYFDSMHQRGRLTDRQTDTLQQCIPRCAKMVHVLHQKHGHINGNYNTHSRCNWNQLERKGTKKRTIEKCDENLPIWKPLPSDSQRAAKHSRMWCVLNVCYNVEDKNRHLLDWLCRRWNEL